MNLALRALLHGAGLLLSTDLGAQLTRLPTERVSEMANGDPVIFTDACCALPVIGNPFTENYKGPVHPSISQDGSRITFSTNACSLGPGLAGRVHQHYVRDLAAATDPVLVSSLTGGAPASEGSGIWAEVSPDGAAAVFVHNSSLLAGCCQGPGSALGCCGPSNLKSDVFLKTLPPPGVPLTGMLELRAVTDVTDEVGATEPRISGNLGTPADPRYRVVYRSKGPYPVDQVWVYDTLLDQTLLVSNPSQGPALSVEISTDGGTVAWVAAISTEVAGRVARAELDLDTLTVLQSAPVSLRTIRIGRGELSLSADGRKLAYSSDRDQTSAVAPGINVYVWTQGAQPATQLVSAGSFGADLQRLSGDGAFIAFRTLQTDYDGSGDDTDGLSDVYLVDLRTPSLDRYLVSHSPFGQQASAGPVDVAGGVAAGRLFLVFSAEGPDTDFEAQVVDNCGTQAACPPNVCNDIFLTEFVLDGP